MSGWSTKRPREAGDWLSVDLGETHSIDEVHLLSAIRIRDVPHAAVLETSLDGETWTERSRLDLNWYWWNGHPKLDDQGRVSFYFEPVPARHLRLRLFDGSPHYDWSVTEMFVRAADAPQTEGGEADLLAGLLAERRGFVGMSYHSLHARYAPAVDSTPWDEVARDYARAARASPDDPEPLYRLGRVLWIKQFFGGGAHRTNVLSFDALGLGDLAIAESRRRAAVEKGSFCVDRALAHASDEAERTRLTEIRRGFDPPVELAADLGPAALAGRGLLPERVEAGGYLPSSSSGAASVRSAASSSCSCMRSAPAGCAPEPTTRPRTARSRLRGVSARGEDSRRRRSDRPLRRRTRPLHASCRALGSGPTLLLAARPQRSGLRRDRIPGDRRAAERVRSRFRRMRAITRSEIRTGSRRRRSSRRARWAPHPFVPRCVRGSRWSRSSPSETCKLKQPRDFAPHSLRAARGPTPTPPARISDRG